MKFWIDQNIRQSIFEGVRSGCPEHEFDRVVDTEFLDFDDESLLEEAARRGIIIITHDENTLVGFAYHRVRNNVSMPGVILVRERTPTGDAVDDLILLIGAGESGDFDRQVRFIPLNL